MSKPKVDWGKPFEGVSTEVRSAMSALNMYPEPLPEEEQGEYLSESDFWAKHSMEHLFAALDSQEAMRKQVMALRHQLWRYWLANEVSDEVGETLMAMIDEIV